MGTHPKNRGAGLGTPGVGARYQGVRRCRGDAGHIGIGRRRTAVRHHEEAAR